MYGRAYRVLIFVSACFNKVNVDVRRQDFFPPGAVVIGDDGRLSGMADERKVARIIGDDIEIRIAAQHLFFMLRGMIGFCPDMFGNGLGDDVHRLGNEDDIPALYHLPDRRNLPWQKVVGIELFHACLLFVFRQAMKCADGSAPHKVNAEEFVEERVDPVPAYLQEVIGRVGVKQGPTDVH